MDRDRIALIAQEISFAFEDHYVDADKRTLFLSLFDRYMPYVDMEEVFDLYEAIVLLGRKEPFQFENMVKELKDLHLISD